MISLAKKMVYNPFVILFESLYGHGHQLYLIILRGYIVLKKWHSQSINLIEQLIFES